MKKITHKQRVLVSIAALVILACLPIFHSLEDERLSGDGYDQLSTAIITVCDFNADQQWVKAAISRDITHRLSKDISSSPETRAPPV